MGTPPKSSLAADRCSFNAFQKAAADEFARVCPDLPVAAPLQRTLLSQSGKQRPVKGESVVSSRLSRGLILVAVLAPLLAAADTGVTSLVLDPLAPNTLYAGTPNRGVLKSTNGGANWTPTGLTNTPSSLWPLIPVSRLGSTQWPLGLLTSVSGGDSWTARGHEEISYPFNGT
jgi:hypothetical protein